MIEDEERWWECRVKDTGAGMPAEVLRQIIDPFYTTKNPYKATGLGLAIAFEIVESHKGKIWAESEEGKGTTFVVRLPGA